MPNPPFSLVTPSPDSTQAMGGPSPSTEEPDYYTMWNQQRVYNSNYHQMKREGEESYQQPQCKSESIPFYTTQQPQHVANEGGKPLVYSDYNQCYGYPCMPKNDGGFRSEYTDGLQSHAELHDDDSIGSSNGVGGSSTLSHDPTGVVISYQSTISGGICDLPTPDLTPTDNKATVLNDERNVFF